jgi:hypothetical protein
MGYRAALFIFVPSYKHEKLKNDRKHSHQLLKLYQTEKKFGTLELIIMVKGSKLKWI